MQIKLAKILDPVFADIATVPRAGGGLVRDSKWGNYAANS